MASHTDLIEMMRHANGAELTRLRAERDEARACAAAAARASGVYISAGDDYADTGHVQDVVIQLRTLRERADARVELALYALRGPASCPYTRANHATVALVAKWPIEWLRPIIDLGDVTDLPVVEQVGVERTTAALKAAVKELSTIRIENIKEQS